MSLVINTNTDALTAYRNLSNTQNKLSDAVTQLSSGLRINKAADDAAGLAISQNLTSQVNGIGQAVRNAQDGINVVQTADGALSETQNILQRLNTLAVQSANATNDDNARADIQQEVNQDVTELNNIASGTKFNNIALLDGSFKSQTFQVGYQNDGTSKLNVTIDDMNATSLGLNSTGTGPDGKTSISGVDLTTQSGAQAAITTIATALQTVSTQRAKLGAIQNSLQHTINNLNVTQENLQASNSSIQDTDMAATMTSYTQANILSQAGTSMLKQANSEPNAILSLLQG